MELCSFPCDLHGHTNRSDGNDTPVEFLKHAAERKVRIAAITDHDKVPPKSVEVDGKTVDIREYAASLGVKLIPGIEISCETHIEDCHLVCFGCDWDDPFFKWLDDFTVQSKTDSYKLLVERLGEMNMPLSWEEILDNHGSPIPESSIQKKMIFNMIAEKGYTKTWSEAKMMVKRTPRLSIDRAKPDAVETIHAIHRIGGIIIQAHPYLVADRVQYREKEISRAEFIEHLIFEGLDGIEARYTYDKTSYGGGLSKEEIYHRVIRDYAGRIPIISGGSDYHADRKKGVENQRDIGECGLTESEFYSNPLLMKLL